MKSLLTKIISVLTIFTFCIGLTACNTNKCADGHSWKLTSTTATCYVGGIETYSCETCKETKTENVEAYEHDLVQSSYTAPTCKTNGEEVKKCSRCGFENKQTILVIDHNYEIKSTTPSTCTVKGSQTLECSMCHETKTESLELKDHDYKLVKTTPSSCVVHGSNEFKCNDCAATKSEQLEFSEHKYEIQIVEATCFTHGGTVEKCSVCQDTKPVNETPLLTHSFGADDYCTHCGIYKTLFDETKLNIQHTVGTGLGWIGGDLIPKFNTSNTIIDNYWKNHIVTVTVYLFNTAEELIGEKDFASQIDKNGKLTIQSTTQTPLQDTQPNKISLRLKADGAFSAEVLTDCASFKIELSCDGSEKIEKTYEIEK